MSTKTAKPPVKSAGKATAKPAAKKPTPKPKPKPPVTVTSDETAIKPEVLPEPVEGSIEEETNEVMQLAQQIAQTLGSAPKPEQDTIVAPWEDEPVKELTPQELVENAIAAPRHKHAKEGGISPTDLFNKMKSREETPASSKKNFFRQFTR